MSSSSSSDDDEEIRARLMSSVDLNIYNDSMYQQKSECEREEKPLPKSENFKSNRYIDNAEEIFQSDLNVPETTKKYIGDKLSKIIRAQYEYIDQPLNASKRNNKYNNNNKKRVKEYVKLISNAPVIDLDQDPNPDIIQIHDKNFKIKRRLIEPEPDESDKIMHSHIPEHLIQADTRFWKSRRKAKMYEYQMKDNIGLYQEPKTEWTDLRKKNNWSADRIKSNCKIRRNDFKRK